MQLEWSSYPTICLDGNPLNSPPAEIVEQGIEAVREYFSSLEAGSSQLNELKLILVGEGGSGKTSLSRGLRGAGFDETESQTHGINIVGWKLPGSVPSFKFNIWDFGGQEIMHATHQFFLSRRSIYLLVLDGRREERTEYWLRLIETFGKDSPILVVLNKADENPSFDVNRQFLLDKYPSIKGFFRTSCAQQMGIQELTAAIHPIAVDVEIAQTEWPSSWLRVKQEVESSNENYTTYDRFDEVCRGAKVREEARDTLLDYLHDLGVVLHFRDFELEGMQVLNPEWVTAGVYAILNSNLLAQSGGELALDDVRRLLPSDNYPPTTRRYLIELMRKFELCYRIGDGSVLVPDLLPVQQPGLPAYDPPSIGLLIQYGFLPPSVLPRLMVRLHQDITQRWRSGMLLEDANFGAEALVRADRDSRSIEIDVAGEHRREYCAVLLGALQTIHHSYSGLRTKELVRMPDRRDIVVSYKHLIKLEKLGVSEYIPDGADETYDVASLLGTVRASVDGIDEVLLILRKLASDADTEETLLQKANDVVMLQPNFFGIGVNLNNAVRHFFRGKD
ncbi:MAG: COR domain-containing protein [Actinomycetota bacterium]